MNTTLRLLTIHHSWKVVSIRRVQWNEVTRISRVSDCYIQAMILISSQKISKIFLHYQIEGQ